jgi:hypothetical protein
MNYLSFSLWGDEPIYNIGSIKNAELWKIFYHDWQMVVFYDNTVPNNTIDKLKSLGVICKNMTDSNVYGMFWRFFAVDLPNSEYCVFRDADSRLSIREKLAVDEWINSGKTLHVMRDHPYHRIPCGNDRLGILGGMWGIKSKKIPLIKLIQNYPNKNRIFYGEDQTFLRNVYSLFENDRFTHDDFFEKKPFPIKRENGRFIGERIDENENPVTDDYKYVLNN